MWYFKGTYPLFGSYRNPLFDHDFHGSWKGALKSFVFSWHFSIKRFFEDLFDKYQDRHDKQGYEDPLLSFELDDYRPIDGEGTNHSHPDWGKTGTQMIRLSPPAYEDGISVPAGSSDRPDPRLISNVIFAQTEDTPEPSGLSNVFWVWGQFIDHDITLTPEGETESVYLRVPTGDPWFDPYGTGQMGIPTHRAGYMDGTGENGAPREYVNLITPFIDASMIYGSDPQTQAYLKGEGGYLRMGDNGYLPQNDEGMYSAGDVRANENIALTSMHTVWAKEHNHWVDKLKQAHPDWDADTLYEHAKAIVSAEIQAITYNEFLPVLLGPSALTDYEGYQTHVNPQVSVEFSTAAFRFGHSLLSSLILTMDESGDDVGTGSLTLRDAFFNPSAMTDDRGMEDILRGLASSYAQELDARLIDDVRSFLFGPPGAGGLDLASLNIFRGRDLGIGSLNDVREALGLETYESFYDLAQDYDLAGKLETLYGDIDNVDLYVGGLIETPYGEALVGETFYTIILDQFSRFRDADPYWYENIFNEAAIHEINETSLSDILLRNSDIDYLQQDIFEAAIRQGGTDGKDKLYGSEERDLLIGFDGNDRLIGKDGDDTLYGGEGRDRLFGGQGDDFLAGGKDKNFLFGGTGADIFYFGKDDVKGRPDRIKDFNVHEGDTLDIYDILEGYNPVDKDIADFVEVTNRGRHSIVSVNEDGQGRDFDKIAIVENNRNLSLDDLLGNNDPLVC